MNKPGDGDEKGSDILGEKTNELSERNLSAPGCCHLEPMKLLNALRGSNG
jgi:hypothetical protein